MRKPSKSEPPSPILEALAHLAATSLHVSQLIDRHGKGYAIITDDRPEFVMAENSWRLAILHAENIVKAQIAE